MGKDFEIRLSGGGTLNLPTLLTLARIGVVPFIAALLFMPRSVIGVNLAQTIATTLFVLAALTDWLDGYLARRWGQQTSLGALLDPVADKFLVATCVILLVELGRLSPMIAIIIVGREIAVSALREWMASLGKSKVVAVASIGKLKTAAQMIGIPFLLCDIRIAWFSTLDIGRPLMWVAAALTVWSMVGYLQSAATSLRAATFRGKEPAC